MNVGIFICHKITHRIDNKLRFLRARSIIQIDDLWMIITQREKVLHIQQKKIKNLMRVSFSLFFDDDSILCLTSEVDFVDASKVFVVIFEPKIFLELIVKVISMEVDRFPIFKDDKVWRSSQIDKSLNIRKGLFDLWNVLLISFKVYLIEKS